MVNWLEFFAYADGKLIWIKPTSRRAKVGAEAGYDAPHGYRAVRLFNKMRYCHRIIWEIHNGPIPEGLVIDHINRIRNDNRIENLRVVTQRENVTNTFRIPPHGIPGLYFDNRPERKRPWILNRGGKLAGFKTKEEAVLQGMVFDLKD